MRRRNIRAGHFCISSPFQVSVLNKSFKTASHMQQIIHTCQSTYSISVTTAKYATRNNTSTTFTSLVAIEKQFQSLKGLDQGRHHLTTLCGVEIDYLLSNDCDVCEMVRFETVTMHGKKRTVAGNTELFIHLLIGTG